MVEGANHVSPKSKGDLHDKIIEEGLPLPQGNVLHVVWMGKHRSL